MSAPFTRRLNMRSSLNRWLNSGPPPLPRRTSSTISEAFRDCAVCRSDFTHFWRTWVNLFSIDKLFFISNHSLAHKRQYTHQHLHWGLPAHRTCSLILCSYNFMYISIGAMHGLSKYRLFCFLPRNQSIQHPSDVETHITITVQLQLGSHLHRSNLPHYQANCYRWEYQDQRDPGLCQHRQPPLIIPAPAAQSSNHCFTHCSASISLMVDFRKWPRPEKIWYDHWG